MQIHTVPCGPCHTRRPFWAPILFGTHQLATRQVLCGPPGNPLPLTQRPPCGSLGEIRSITRDPMAAALIVQAIDQFVPLGFPSPHQICAGLGARALNDITKPATHSLPEWPFSSSSFLTRVGPAVGASGAPQRYPGHPECPWGRPNCHLSIVGEQGVQAIDLYPGPSPPANGASIHRALPRPKDVASGVWGMNDAAPPPPPPPFPGPRGGF